MHFKDVDKYVLSYLSSFWTNADINNILMLSKHFSTVPFLYNDYIEIEKIPSQKAASRVQKLLVLKNPILINNYVWNQNIGIDYRADENIKNHINKFVKIKDLALHETWDIIDANLNPVTHLTFGNYFNSKLYQNQIPNTVTHLKFGHHFNQFIKKDTLPSSITNLTFGDRFNQNLVIGSIPLKVQKYCRTTYLNML
jgi:hypothetical protein